MRSKALLLLALMATVAIAQTRGKGPMCRYDSSTETTITGSIEAVNTPDTMCQSGTHITVKTDTGSVEVALGPARFLADQNLVLKKGDQVQIVGAKANMMGGGILVAREVTSGGKTVTLRDSKGVPLWSGGMGR